MSDQPELFSTTPVPRLQKGDRVFLRTLWGEEECEVLDVHTEDGFPMTKLLCLKSADTISANVAAVRRTQNQENHQ